MLMQVKSKALRLLGITVGDLRAEKALLVLGEAPGHEVPAGPLPHPDTVASGVGARRSWTPEAIDS